MGNKKINNIWTMIVSLPWGFQSNGQRLFNMQTRPEVQKTIRKETWKVSNFFFASALPHRRSRLYFQNWNIKLWNETWNSIFKLEICLVGKLFLLLSFRNISLWIFINTFQLYFYDSFKRLSFLPSSAWKCFQNSRGTSESKEVWKKICQMRIHNPSIKSNLFWWISFDGEFCRKKEHLSDNHLRTFKPRRSLF